MVMMNPVSLLAIRLSLFAKLRFELAGSAGISHRIDRNVPYHFALSRESE